MSPIRARGRVSVIAEVKRYPPPRRMRVMSESPPEPVMNGHGSQESPSQLVLSAGETPDRALGAAEHAIERERQPAMLDDLCRLAVYGPGRTVELAVPAHVPLVDLLP